LLSSYSILARATTSTSAQFTSGDPNNPIYTWSASANAGFQWQQGGLVRFKTRGIISEFGTSPQDLFVADNESQPCTDAQSQGPSWKAMVLNCASPYSSNIATLVSTTPVPATVHAGNEFYLARGGHNAAAVSPSSKEPDTKAYYAASGADASLAAFR